MFSTRLAALRWGLASESALLRCRNTGLSCMWMSVHRRGLLVCTSHSSEKPKVWACCLFSLCPCSPLLNPSPVCFSKVTEISMGEFLMHSSVVWLNPHPSLGRIRKDPEMTVFGESASPTHIFYCHPWMVTDKTLISTNSTVYWVCCTARQECLQQHCFNIRSWNTAIYFMLASKSFCGLLSFSRLSPRGIQIQKWDTDVFSLTSFQESGDIGLQGKQQAEEEGKSCFSCTHSYIPQNWIFGLKCWKHFFPPLFSPTLRSQCDDQTNSRSALSHGDSDPFKFRRLIPLSALQVRLGNAAGKRTAHWHILSTKSLKGYISFFCSSTSFIFPHSQAALNPCPYMHTHTHPLWHFYSAPTLPPCHLLKP